MTAAVPAQEKPIVRALRWRPGPITLFACDVALRLVSVRYEALRRFLELAPPRLTEMLSRARAVRTARDAMRQVPAYRLHLADAGIVDVEPFSGLPETDKVSYVDRHPLAARCVGGRIPLRGSTIDESSGSTGTPYNWVRSDAERRHVRRMISFFARYTFGDDPLVVLNAFSMGAWATGLTTAIALEANGLVKATGPDVDKILGTMRELGPDQRYLIVGYPPFLKLLLDEGDRIGFAWERYRMHALMGGEGNSEALRDYLLRRFDTVFSGYGATDIEIGLAAETPVCIGLRRLAMARPEIARALFGEDHRSPMVFQYNPLLHHIETNAAGELLFTVNRHATLSPKVRYNVHDEGGVLRDDELRARLAAFGITLESLVPGHAGRLVRMPYLFVFGRKDSTISVMGANIYPADVEAAVYAEPSLARVIRSFRLAIREEIPGETRPLLSVELEHGEPSAQLSEAIASAVERHLLGVNRDYAEAAREYPSLLPPIVELHARGAGPFAADRGRIKFRYV
ncbi:MAG TPA: phenylacetate--CoA ligase family protein, partial [Candidatus Limnocylindria bacterium]|nr:phenylacetate--CoA ligase family protein [Candidatus Limnocylindria bacterium]